jgi:hypothetical protein
MKMILAQVMKTANANIVVYLVDLKNPEWQRYFQHNYYIHRFDEKTGVSR